MDPAAIPVLSGEQVDQIPPELLSFLHNYGRVEDYGDLKIINVEDDRHNFTIMSIAWWVANGSLEHGELRVEQPKLMGLEAVPRPVKYDRSIHQQDTTFVATAATHARFLQTLGLYMFSIRAGMRDLQAYVSKTICTQYPIYEAELVALLTKVFDYTDDLSSLDPNLATFVSKRVLCLHQLLVTNSAMLPLLCKTISAKDRFLSLAARADHAILAHALAELRTGIGEDVETDALLEFFVKKIRTTDNAPQAPQPAPLLTSSAQNKRKRGRPSKAEIEAKAVRLSAIAATGAVARNDMANDMANTAHTESVTTSTGSMSPESILTQADEEPIRGDAGPSHGHPRALRDVERLPTAIDSTQNILENASDNQIRQSLRLLI